MDQVIREHGFHLDDVASHLWLTDIDLKTLTESGHYIGLHSYDHPYELAELNYQEQLDQYKRNYGHIHRVINKEIECMSYPLNSYNEDSLEILSQMGIQCGFRANMVPPSCGDINPSCLELAREDSANLLLVMKGSFH
mgnify:FL=1